MSVMSVMSVGWGRNARASNCIAHPGRFQQQPCQGHCRGARKDKIVLSLGRVNIPIFAGYSLSVLSILVSF